MTEPEARNNPPNPEGALQALIEHPLSSALSTNVLHPIFQDPDEDESSIGEYWQIIVKRKWTVISFFLIVVTAVTIATFLMTPIYRSTTMLQIEKESSKVVDFKEVMPVEVSGDRDFYQTQYELLKSNSLAQRVIEQLALGRESAFQSNEDQGLFHWLSENPLFHWLSENPLADKKAPSPQQLSDESKADILKQQRTERFLMALTVEPVRNSRLVKVSFDSPDPVLATRVANAVVKNFIDINQEHRFDASSYARTFLEERIKQAKSKLEEAERAQVDYARAQKIFSVDKEGATTNGQNLQEFNNALAKVQQERIKAESLYMQLQESKSEELPQVMDNQLVQRLRESKLKLEAEYQNNLRLQRPEFPKMQGLIKQIAVMKAQIEEEQNNIRNSITASYKAAASQEALLTQKLDTSKKEMFDMQDRSVQFNILKREADTNRQFYEGLLQRLKEVSVAGGVGTNNISVVDKAEVPSHQFKPSLSLNLLIAMSIGLLGGVLLAFFFDYLDDTIKQASDVEKLLGIPVLGLIPESKELRKGSTALALATKHSRSPLAEAYRSVRTALQFSTAGGAPKLLGVTSCNVEEGKSTTAISLAIQFAQVGSRVLLIDADLRKPSLHSAFGVKNSLGLTNYLAGTTKPADICRTTPVANLWLISTGPLPPNPAELLSGSKMRALLELARGRFDHVIIDSSPILGLADALVVSSIVDSMLLVVEWGVTPSSAVQSSLKRLMSVRVRPVGCVLTRMHGHTQSNGYDYYYSYGAKHDASNILTA